MVSIFAVSTATLLALSFVLDAYFYWNIAGLAALMPMLAGTLTNRWLRSAHLVYGLILGGGDRLQLFGDTDGRAAQHPG